mgnify:FL=1
MDTNKLEHVRGHKEKGDSLLKESIYIFCKVCVVFEIIRKANTCMAIRKTRSKVSIIYLNN